MPIQRVDGIWILTPDFYGFEYELQLGIPIPDRRIRAVPVQRTGSLHNFFSDQHSCYFINNVTSAQWRKFHCTPDVGNIEIRNGRKSGRLEDAVAKLEEQVPIIAESIGQGLEEFGLFLPQIIRQPNGVTGCTKHLNVSFKVSKDVNRKLLMNLTHMLYKRFPHYFEPYVGVRLDIKSNRLHIKLPYRFTDYSGLWDGTAVLPSVKDVEKHTTYHRNGNVLDFMVKPFWGWEAICLGWWKDDAWTTYKSLT